MQRQTSGMSWVLLIFLLATVSSCAQVVASLVVRGPGSATVALGGDWQFHLGDDPAWAAPGLDDSGWENIKADKPWGEQGHRGYTGYAWYRRHIDFVPVAGAAQDVALIVPRIDDAYEVYWNGVPAGGFGKLPPDPVWSFEPTVKTFGLGREGNGVLAIRVWKAPFFSFESGRNGGTGKAMRAGSPEAAAAYKAADSYVWLRSHQYNFALDFLYALVALLSMLAWLRDRGQRILLWMSLFGLAQVLNSVLGAMRLPLPERIALGLLQPAISLADLSLWFLLLYVLKLDGNARLRRWTSVLAIVSIVTTSIDGSLTLLDWSQHTQALQVADGLLTLVFTALEAFPLVLIAFGLRKKLDASRWLVTTFAFLTSMTVVVKTALSQGQRYTHLTLSEKIDNPLFAVRGNSFNFVSLTATFLFISILYAVYRYSVEERERQGAIEQEFKSAQELQRVLIPETLPSLPGFSVTSAYIPAQEVGGDFFQVIPKADGATLVIVGDVSGKGLKAAMTVALIVGTVRTLAEMFDEPADILSGLNRRLTGRLNHGFVTCVALRLTAEGECTLATAGHPAPYLNREEVMMPGSLPLGLAPSVSFEQKVVQLEVGDCLTLYTDGLLEARSESGELFSFDRLGELLATRPDAQQAGQAAVAFGQDDDITVLTVTRLAVGAESTTSLVAPKLVAVPA